MLSTSRFLIRSSLSHGFTTFPVLHSLSQTLRIKTPTTLSIVSQRFFAEGRDYNSHSSGSFRKNSPRDETFGDRRDFNGPREKPFNRENREERGNNLFIPHPLTVSQQETIAENKFNQFVDTVPNDPDARTKISISIMSNFSRNDNSHAVISFFNKLQGLKKDLLQINQAHYAICIKELLKLGDEKTALKHYETMKQNGVLPDDRMLGNLVSASAKHSKQIMDLLVADAKKFKLSLPVPAASNALIVLMRDREYARAKDLYHRFIQDFDVKPDYKLYSIYVTLLLRSTEDKTEEALQIYNKLRSENTADIFLYMAIVKGLVHKKQYEKVEAVLKNMKADGIQPDDRFKGYVDFLAVKDTTAAAILQKLL